MSGRVRIGVDIGGTFTDFTVLGADGAQRLWKEDSTPDDPVRAIVEQREIGERAADVDADPVWPCVLHHGLAGCVTPRQRSTSRTIAITRSICSALTPR